MIDRIASCAREPELLVREQQTRIVRSRRCFISTIRRAASITVTMPAPSSSAPAPTSQESRCTPRTTYCSPPGVDPAPRPGISPLTLALCAVPSQRDVLDSRSRTGPRAMRSSNWSALVLPIAKARMRGTPFA